MSRDKLFIGAKYLTERERDVQINRKGINNYTNKYTERKTDGQKRNEVCNMK